MNQGLEQTLANLATILGFLLALVLAVREVRKNRIKVCVSNAEYLSFYMSGRIVACMKLIIVNDSLAPVALTSVAFLSKRRKKYPGDLNSNLFLGVGDRTEEARMRSTPFPINLAPKESRQINLMFHFTKSDSKKLHLPMADNLPMEEFRQCIPEHVNEFWPYRFCFSTHHCSVVISGKAKVCDVKETMKEFWKANDRAKKGA